MADETTKPKTHTVIYLKGYYSSGDRFYKIPDEEISTLHRSLFEFADEVRTPESTMLYAKDRVIEQSASEKQKEKKRKKTQHHLIEVPDHEVLIAAKDNEEAIHRQGRFWHASALLNEQFLDEQPDEYTTKVEPIFDDEKYIVETTEISNIHLSKFYTWQFEL